MLFFVKNQEVVSGVKMKEGMIFYAKMMAVSINPLQRQQCISKNNGQGDAGNLAVVDSGGRVCGHFFALDGL